MFIVFYIYFKGKKGINNMKLNRLLEIMTILLNKKTTTATELSSRFGVSVRTIYRDVEVLSTSGVPVFTTQGNGGGISIMEDYTVNRTAVSDKDKENIILALKTLQSIKYPEIDAVLEKLGSLFKNNNTDWISVDLSPWGSNPNADNKFIDIRTAVMQQKVIEIEYINTQNVKTRRKIEPLRLIFKYRAWYLWGYCRERKDYRTFRISRIKKVYVTDEAFDRTIIHTQLKENNTEESGNKPIIHCVLQFTEQTLYRLYDDYDIDYFHDNGDGTYNLEVDFPEDEWVYGYILSFGTYVKVISPPHLRDIIRERSKKIFEYYQ
jgi:predicted DNA-binding transcriptional regulator YafY